MRARWTVGLGTAALGLTLLLAGCGGGSGGAVASGPTGGGAATVTGPPTGTTDTAPSTSGPAGSEGGTSPSGDAGSGDVGSGAPFPVACGTVTAVGDPTSVPAGSAVSLAQIGSAIGFTAIRAMPLTFSATGGFRGYESCAYDFKTPAGGGSMRLYLVAGTDPVTGKPAAADFADVRRTRIPLGDLGCNGSGCGDDLTDSTAVGDQALTGKDKMGYLALIVLKGDVYLELSQSDLKQERLLRLAKLVLAAVH